MISYKIKSDVITNAYKDMHYTTFTPLSYALHGNAWMQRQQ